MIIFFSLRLPKAVVFSLQALLILEYLQAKEKEVVFQSISQSYPSLS